VLAATANPTERTAGRSPLYRAIVVGVVFTRREALSLHAQSVLAGDEVDPVRRRVAEEADRFLASDERGTFRVWVDTHQPFDDVDPGVEGAVALVTFHAAKGREWAGVVVTGVEDGLIPHSAAVTAAQRQEEARLLYVALTRASEELVITHARERRLTRSQESPFLGAVRTTLLADRPAAPPEAIRGRPAAQPDPLEPLRAWRGGVARAAGIDDRAVCSDQTLRALLDQPPVDVAEIARRLGITPSAAERLAPKLLSLLGAPGWPSAAGTPRASSR
jgi:DNA helicase-2/ATP-dependent DNA helicase PcrA